eukprot:scaffold97635_cov60-Phaeocystis_antarctica.AAC.1
MDVHGTSTCSGLQLIDDDELDHISGEWDGVEDQRGLGVAAEARVVPAGREEVHRARLLMVRAEAWLGGWLGPGCKAAWIQAAPDERERDETRGEADEEDGLRQLRHVPAAAEVVGLGAVLPHELEGREPLPPRPPAQPYRTALRPLPEESWRIKVAGGWLEHPRQWLGALWPGL